MSSTIADQEKLNFLTLKLATTSTEEVNNNLKEVVINKQVKGLEAKITKLDLINEEGTMPTTTTPEGQAEAISAEETEEEVGKEVVDKAKLEINEAASNVMILLTGPKIAPTEMSMPLKKLRKKKKKTWMKSSTTFPLPKLKKNQAIWDSSGPCSKTMKLSIQKTS